MDRIQKALDKARQQAAREGVSQNGQTQPDFTRPKAVAEKHRSAFENIEYSHTNVQKITLDQLMAKRVIATDYNNPEASSFRMLRTQVLTRMRANQWQTLAITSARDAEGKSLIASNLAMAMAMELNQTVLLVDMDLRKPMIADYFSLSVDVGLKDYMEKDIKLSDTLINPGVKRLVILPGKGRADNSAELLSSPKMAQLVAELKARYSARIILFDLPPMLQTDDLKLTADYFDGILFVVEDGKNPAADLQRAMQLLNPERIIGTVLNKANQAQQHQYY